MGNSIRKLRRKHDLTQEELATKIGSTRIPLSSWGCNWDEVPVWVMRDLAILFECGAADVLGEEIPVAQWRKSPYAAGNHEEEEIYGSLGSQQQQARSSTSPSAAWHGSRC